MFLKSRLLQVLAIFVVVTILVLNYFDMRDVRGLKVFLSEISKAQGIELAELECRMSKFGRSRSGRCLFSADEALLMRYSEAMQLMSLEKDTEVEALGQSCLLDSRFVKNEEKKVFYYKPATPLAGLKEALNPVSFLLVSYNPQFQMICVDLEYSN